jgi:long-chain fatty acid transport protein
MKSYKNGQATCLKTQFVGRSNMFNASRWLVVLLHWGVLTTALGLGVRIPNQDPEAIGRANAFAATADNPSAIYYNPAGITQLTNHNIQINMLGYFGIYADYESPSGQKVENEREIIPVPSLYYTYTPTNSDFSYGLGVYAPFGLSMEWPSDSPFRTGGVKGCLDYITVNPVVAYKLSPTFSVAAGPTINYSKVSLTRGIGLIPGDTFSFDGDGVNYGFTAGVLWQPDPQWSFGLSYRSAVNQDYDGTATAAPAPPFPGSFSSDANLDYPQIIIAGVSYRPNENWNLEVNLDWADWDSFNYANIANAGTIPFHWESSFFVEVGATRYLEGGWYVSAGYFFSENSTPDLYYNPIIADGNLHVAAFGVGRKGETLSWALACELIGGPWNEVENPANPAVAGKYRLFTPTLSASVAFHF